MLSNNISANQIRLNWYVVAWQKKNTIVGNDSRLIGNCLCYYIIVIDFYTTDDLVFCQQDEEVFKYHIINDRVFPDHVHDGMLKTTALGKSYQIMFHFDSKNQVLNRYLPSL